MGGRWCRCKSPDRPPPQKSPYAQSSAFWFSGFCGSSCGRFRFARGNCDQQHTNHPVPDFRFWILEDWPQRAPRTQSEILDQETSARSVIFLQPPASSLQPLRRSGNRTAGDAEGERLRLIVRRGAAGGVRGCWGCAKLPWSRSNAALCLHLLRISLPWPILIMFLTRPLTVIVRR